MATIFILVMNDAGLHVLVPHLAGSAIERPVTKLGGLPVWIGDPEWPVSRQTERPMMFLGQFRLPGEQLSMAYLFMTQDEDEFVDDTWRPEAGENALIIQPGRVPEFIFHTLPSTEGPTISTDLQIEMVPATDDQLAESFTSRMHGTPTWVQYQEYAPGAWQFFLQLEAPVFFQFEEAGSYRHVGIFGDNGVGYGFLSPDGLEGRFLWQC